MLKIAIIGKGIAGLSAAYQLSSKAGLIDVYFEAPGASMAASGLVHSFVGDTGLKSLAAEEALADTFELFESLEGAFYTKTPFIRRLLHETMRENFSKASFEDVEFIDQDHILIKKAAKVNVPRYLEILEKELKAKGVHFFEKKIKDLSELFFYDKIIIAAGYGIKELVPSLKMKYLKGQSLKFKNRQRHMLPLIAKGYLVPFDDYVIIGSTYERHFHSTSSDLYQAYRLLEEPLKQHFHPYHEVTPLGIESGVRVAHPNSCHPKIITQDNLLILTGYGSRGLLYHNFIAKLLAKHLEGQEVPAPQFLQVL